MNNEVFLHFGPQVVYEVNKPISIYTLKNAGLNTTHALGEIWVVLTQQLG